MKIFSQSGFIHCKQLASVSCLPIAAAAREISDWLSGVERKPPHLL